jgi:hypothetical protein
MQNAFVEWAQGAWEGIARALDFDKKRLQKTALQREFAPVSEGEGDGPPDCPPARGTCTLGKR